jgi:peptidyl-tRNA hydrolase
LRLRFGISQPPKDLPRPTFVLQKFKSSEQQQYKQAMELARKAVILWAEKGEAAAMNQFNKIK